MRENVRIAGIAGLLWAMVIGGGCNHANPIEPTVPRNLLSMDADGDAPLHIEYSHESFSNGTIVLDITTDSTFWASGWNEVAWAGVPHGHVQAYVSVYDNYSEFGGKELLHKLEETDGVAVEITGIVP